MRRRSYRPWLVLLVALGITASPRDLRLQARRALLDSSARLARLVASPAEAAVTRAETASAEQRRLQRQLHRLKSENARLSQALELAGAVPEVLQGRGAVALVPVDAAPLTAGTSIHRRLLLTEGENLGIAPGQAAVLGSALVGVVVQSSRRAAELRLLTDPGFRIRARVQNLELEGLVRGTAAGYLLLEIPPKKDAIGRPKVRVGHVVTSSPQSSLCPIPSIIGQVISVEHFGALTRARVRPAVDARGISSVVVLRPGEARR
jgi:rod shape-determining protein MreC